MGTSFIEPRLGALSFIAFIPVLKLAFRSSFALSYLYSLLMGLVMFAVANHWVYGFLENLIGAPVKTRLLFAIYLIYSAQVICLFVLTARWFARKLPSWASLAVTPLAACSIFHYWPAVFQFNPALTQINFTHMLQPVALFSHWSLAAFIIFINLLLVRQWLPKAKPQHLLTAPLTAFSLGFFLWLVLGAISRWNFNSDNAVPTPLTIGFHQPLEPVGAEQPSLKTGFTRSYTGELANSYYLAIAGASLIVWPESRPKDILDKPWVLNAYKNHAQKMAADLMVQEVTQVQQRPAQFRNASIFISKTQEHRLHHKVKRIPFGETLPEVLDHGLLGSWLRRFFSGVLKQIQAGEKPQIFTHNNIKILPQICYEFLDGHLVNSTLRQNPEVQLIIAQSNDSWFYSRSQVHLHNAFAVLRAVENRRPLLHVVNGGPSFVIDAYGEIRQRSEYQVAGGFIAELQISKSSQNHRVLIPPKTFIQLATSISLLVYLVVLLKPYRRPKRHRKNRP